MSAPGSANVIFCSFCGFRGLTFFQVFRHLKVHSRATFRCGVEDCPSEYTNFSSFRAHFSQRHEDIYPTINGILPELVNSSFCYVYRLVEQTAPAIDIVDDLSPVYNAPSPPNDLDDRVLERNTNEFAKILLTQGCSHSVPFQHIQNISSSLINFFASISRENSFSNDLEYQLNHLIATPEIFNQYIESNFVAVFHKMVNISGTDDSFAFFPFKKSFFKLLEQFASFNEVFSNSLNTDDFFISMPTLTRESDNIIHINIFIDDFQLCNPLLSKKSQLNSMTGIYYRIISSNKFKCSGQNNIFLLALCPSLTFKNNSEVIMQYIAHRVNKFNDTPFPVTLNSETLLCRVNIGYFSLDSKAASFLLGMKQSFNHQYCCRFCIEQRTLFNQKFTETSDIRHQSLYQFHSSQIHGLIDNEDVYGIQRMSQLRHFSCPDFFEICPLV